MGLSVFFVRVEFGFWSPRYYRVSASHQATAEQLAIREAFKKNYYARHRLITVKISRYFFLLHDPKEQVSLLEIPTIGKFQAAGAKASHAGKSIVKKSSAHPDQEVRR